MATINTAPDLAQSTWAHFIAPYLSGEHPFCRTHIRKVPGLPLDPCPIPPELIVRDHSTEVIQMTMVERGGFAAVIIQDRELVKVVARAADGPTARRAADEVLDWFPQPEKVDGVVPVDFWQSGPRMFTTTRSIEAPTWDAVANHYPPAVREQLTDLYASPLDGSGGRIILWHGPPGTGKTSAIRTLARMWRDSARLQVVLEPEQVFRNSSGLMQVLLDHHDRCAETWRVLVVEDADNLVRRNQDSPVLSRLLNVGDGLVGQGLRILVLLTTNEAPGRLHPALSRPGRCLSSIEFRAFTAAEALDVPNVDPSRLAGRDVTLAELMNESSPSPLPAGGPYL